jgi:hypothetical protein
LGGGRMMDDRGGMVEEEKWKVEGEVDFFLDLPTTSTLLQPVEHTGIIRKVKK